MLGANPLESYRAFINGALGSTSGLTQTLAKATPLLLVGLGICIAFRGGVINIGGEGQIIVGALAATGIALALPTWPSWALLPLTLMAGVVMGAIWATSGYPQGQTQGQRDPDHGDDEPDRPAKHELSPARPLDPAQVAAGTNIPQSAALPEAVWLTRLVPRTLLHSGIILALVLAILVYFLLSGTPPSAIASTPWG